MSSLPGRAGPISEGRLRGGILSAAQPVPSGVDWRQGITFNSVCPSRNDRLWFCTEVEADPLDQPVKDGDASGNVVTFDSFMTYAETDCSTWMQRAELGELAQSGFDRVLSRGIAIQLQTNAVGAPNSPSLNSVASDVTPATPVDIVNTLSGLMSDKACDCMSAQTVFHAPIRSIPFFIERQLIEWDSSRGIWTMGPYDFSFDCYSETGPGDVDTAADGSEVWIYASGPVELAIGAAHTPSYEESIIVRTNDQAYLIEHLAALRFDPCCVIAARANVF